MAKPTAALKEFIQNYEGSNVFFVIAGISGALAVGLGAYGSHCKFWYGEYDVVAISVCRIFWCF